MAWHRSDQIVQASGTVSGDVDDDLIVFNPTTRTSVGLSGTGPWLGPRLSAPVTLGDLLAAAPEEFQVARSVCAPDIVATLDVLHQHGMIQVTSSA